MFAKERIPFNLFCLALTCFLIPATSWAGSYKEHKTTTKTYSKPTTVSGSATAASANESVVNAAMEMIKKECLTVAPTGDWDFEGADVESTNGSADLSYYTLISIKKGQPLSYISTVTIKNINTIYCKWVRVVYSKDIIELPKHGSLNDTDKKKEPRDETVLGGDFGLMNGSNLGLEHMPFAQSVEQEDRNLPSHLQAQPIEPDQQMQTDSVDLDAYLYDSMKETRPVIRILSGQSEQAEESAPIE